MPFEKQLAHLDDTERTPERIGGSLPLQILNLLFWILTIVIAIITSSGGFGWSYGSLFEYFRTHITAAHWVNIIWFVIYFLGLVFVIYQVFPYQRNNSVLFRRINFLFILSCIINIVWNIVYSYGHFWAAAALITALLIVLSIIYCSVNIGLKRATAPLEYLCVHLFFSVYLAWVAYLTFQNWSQAAKWRNDDDFIPSWRGEGWNQRGWAILWLCINALITLLILAIRRDIAYGLAFSFIYFAIGSKQRRYLNVSNCAYILAGIFVLLSLIAGAIKLALWLKERKNREVVVVAHPNDRQTAAVANPVVVKEGHPNVAGAIPATGATGPAMGATPYPASGVPTRMV